MVLMFFYVRDEKTGGCKLIPIVLASIESSFDRDRCAKLYEKYKGLMMYTALKKINNYGVAEDMVSDSVIKIIKHFDKIDSFECHHQRNYIVYIVETTCIDYLRRVKKQVAEPIDAMELDYHRTHDNLVTHSPLDELVLKEGYESIVTAIINLPATLKDVAYLHLVHGHDHNEIAKMLNISYDNSKTRLSRAKVAIKKALKGAFAGEVNEIQE